MPKISREEAEECERIEPISEECLSATKQGSVFEFKIRRRYSRVRGDQRGSIKDFSPGARLRMLKTFQKINFTDHPEPLFMTLTYPDEKALPSLEERNTHRKMMARHLEKLTGAFLPAAWRVEWQPRKSGLIVGEVCPHWHWLIFKHRYISYREINRLWKKTIGHDGTVITDIRAVEKASAIQQYMAKYISKEAVSPSLVIAAYQNRIGRQYGWLRKQAIPMHDEHTMRRLPDGARSDLHRLAYENLPQVSERLESSFTLFGDLAEQAAKIASMPTLDNLT